LDARVEIVQKRERFDNDPIAFRATQDSEQNKLRKRITRARTLVSRVAVDQSVLKFIASLCVALKVDGHRGELTIARAARALAAYEGRAKASIGDVQSVAVMSLRHRLRKDPLESVDGGSRVELALAELLARTSPSARLTAVK